MIRRSFYRFATVVAAFLLPLASKAQSVSQADAFLHRLYATYAHAADGSSVSYAFENSSDAFTPDMVRLLRKDQGDGQQVGRLDADPLCACQDDDGLKVEGIAVTRNTRTTATAVVHLRWEAPAAPSTATIRIKLLWTDKGWRISDIGEEEMPSLRRLLTQPLN